MQFLASFIMKGRMQAMMLASSSALLSLLIPPLSIVSSASVSLVTLRRGASEGLYVLIFALLATGLLSALTLGNQYYAVVYGLVFWLPVWLISILLRESRSLVLAIEIAALLGVAGVLVFYLYHPEPAQFWRLVLVAMLEMMQQMQADFPLEAFKKSAEVMASYMTGYMAASVTISSVFGMLMARWWQALLFNPGGFRTEFLALKGHAWPAVATIAIMAASALSSGWLGELCVNLRPILAVLYLFVGIAVVHSLLANLNAGYYLVPMLYVTLLVSLRFTSVVMDLLVLCGLTDTWLNLRNKFSNHPAA